MNRSPRTVTFVVAAAAAFTAFCVAGCSLNSLQRNPALQAAAREANARAREQQQALARTAIAEAVRADNQGQTETAEKRLDEAVRIQGDDANAYAFVGAAVTEQKRPLLALRLLERGYQKPGGGRDDPLLLAALARAARQSGKTERAAEVEREASARAEAILRADAGVGLRRTPEETARAASRLLVVGAYFHEYAKNVPQALKAWRAALALLPNEPTLLNQVGYTLADEGTTPAEWNEALDLTRRALAQAPNDAMIRDSYGWALYRVGDTKAARRVLREAADALPDEPDAHYHLGVALAKLGLANEARAEFARTLRLRPDHEKARKALAGLPAVPDEPAVASSPGAG